MSSYTSTICWRDHLYSIVLPLFFCQRSVESVFFWALCSVLLICVCDLFALPHSEVGYSVLHLSSQILCWLSSDLPTLGLQAVSQLQSDFLTVVLIAVEVWVYGFLLQEVIILCIELSGSNLRESSLPCDLMHLRRIVDFSVCPAFYLLEHSDNC